MEMSKTQLKSPLALASSGGIETLIFVTGWRSDELLRQEGTPTDRCVIWRAIATD